MSFIHSFIDGYLILQVSQAARKLPPYTVIGAPGAKGGEFWKVTATVDFDGQMQLQAAPPTKLNRVPQV